MRSFRDFFTLLFALFLFLLLYRYEPLLEILLTAEPKPVAPRGDLTKLEKTNIKIFENAKDSVVYISTSQTMVDPWSMSVFNVPRGTGSGFVWDKAGHIVTNFHVIEGATEAKVRLSNGFYYDAFLVGADKSHDLAVLKIKPALSAILKPILIGSAKDLKVGQIVYAIGNPFGLDWTMTMGIISALDRYLDEGNGVKIKHVIQTDAAINPGNSGGPLLDSAGRVIGVNTAIYSPSGTSAGIGFAIPIDTVNRVVSQLIAYGKYVPPSLGIESDDRINKILDQRYGIKGVAVLAIAPGSGAFKANLRPAKFYPDGSIVFGDIILKIDGKRVESFQELEEILDEYRIGDEAVLEILRGDKKITVKITLT